MALIRESTTYLRDPEYHTHFDEKRFDELIEINPSAAAAYVALSARWDDRGHYTQRDPHRLAHYPLYT